MCVCVCVCVRARVCNPTYYCVLVSAAHAEADTFFCFQTLMVEIGDHFTKNLDGAHTGISTTRVHKHTYMDPYIQTHTRRPSQ